MTVSAYCHGGASTVQHSITAVNAIDVDVYQIFPWVNSPNGLWESSLYSGNTDGMLGELHSQGDIPIDFRNDLSVMFPGESFTLESIGPLLSHIHEPAMPGSESGE